MITLRIACFFLLLSTATMAQKQVVDRQFWLGASCKLDFKKGFSLTAQIRGRQINDFSRFYGSYLFLTGEYRVNKYLSTFLNYRYSSVVDVGYYHRYALGVEGTLKMKKFTFSMRPMVQKQNQFFTGDDEKNSPNSLYLRPRVQVKYKVTKRVDVYVYGEPFVDLMNKTQVDWWQNSFGLKYEYIKNQKINLFYIWSPDYKKKYIRNYHIFGVDWEFTLKMGKRKVKEKGDPLQGPDDLNKGDSMN